MSPLTLPPRTPLEIPAEAPPTAPGPLLPSALTGPGSFLWFWASPIAVLLLLDLQSYRLIGESLDAPGRLAAFQLGLALLANLLLALGLFLLTRRRARTHGAEAVTGPAWGLPAIGAQIGLLWLVMLSGEQLLKPAVSSWIYPETRYLYHHFAFAMLPLFHGLLRLACGGAVLQENKALGLSLGAAIAGPVLAFSLVQLVESAGRLGATLSAILIVGAGAVMLVGLLRALFLGLRKATRGGPLAERVAIAVLALGLPLGGLALNRTIPFPTDLQSTEVYVITLLNAGALFLASHQLRRRPLVALGLLALALPYTLYFFAIFLPFLPLAVVALLAFGAGFLMLAPALLLGLQVHLLSRAAVAAVAAGTSRRGVLVLILGAAALMPAGFVLRALADRHALNAALDHAFTPSISSGGSVFTGDHAHVTRALAGHRDHKDGVYLPLLSEAYASLVFDGLVLPDDKISLLEELFAGTSITPAKTPRDTFFGRGDNHRRMPRAAPPPRRVEVSALERSHRGISPHVSSVTLRLTLRNPDQAAAEYIQRLALPKGVVAHGFRLQVNGKLVPGRLVEKKSALWVYTMIRDVERRDPGLLFYHAPDELELRVYPVIHDVPSVVEIDLLVPIAAADLRPASPGLDPSLSIQELAGAIAPQLVGLDSGESLVLGLDQMALPPAPRPVYLHLLIDRSTANAFTGDLRQVLRSLPPALRDAPRLRASLVNRDVVPLLSELGSPDHLEEWDATRLDRALPVRGGLHLDVALAHALLLHREKDLEQVGAGATPPPRPVFVLVGAHAAVRDHQDLPLASAWRDLAPGLELHSIGADGTHRELLAAPAPTPLLRLENSVRPLAPDRAPRFSAVAPESALTVWSTASGRWETVKPVAQRSATEDHELRQALGLQVRAQDRARDPGGARDTLKTLLAAGREAGVLTPAASFIVVESAAQWRALEAAEARKLDQAEALDHLEAPAPSAAWVAAVWLALHLLRRRRRGPPLPFSDGPLASSRQRPTAPRLAQKTLP